MMMLCAYPCLVPNGTIEVVLLFKNTVDFDLCPVRDLLSVKKDERKKQRAVRYSL
jgi:hypothetical protein